MFMLTYMFGENDSTNIAIFETERDALIHLIIMRSPLFLWEIWAIDEEVGEAGQFSYIRVSHSEGS